MTTVAFSSLCILRVRSPFFPAVPIQHVAAPPQPIYRRRRLTTSAINAPDTKGTSAPTPLTPPSALPSSQPPSYEVRDFTFRSFRVQYATATPTGTVPSTASIVTDTDTATGPIPTPDAQAPAAVLVHGFGANCEHWRHNLKPLADGGLRVYALDLLGFGMGDKPAPGTLDSHYEPVSYTFDYWTAELSAFIDEIVTPASSAPSSPQAGPCPVFLIANSIGCMVTMQYAVENPARVAALAFISPSLRQLNVRKRSWVQDVVAPLLTTILSYRPIGAFFLDSLSSPRALRKVLRGAYSVHDAVDDDLVRILRNPAYTDGAVDVFLSFISYDTGPIPEDFLPLLKMPALVIWGEEDQFEPFELGQKLRHYSIVEQFEAIEGAGHCAHDEMPERVNKLLLQFVEKHKERTVT